MLPRGVPLDQLKVGVSRRAVPAVALPAVVNENDSDDDDEKQTEVDNVLPAVALDAFMPSLVVPVVSEQVSAVSVESIAAAATPVVSDRSISLSLSQLPDP